MRCPPWSSRRPRIRSPGVSTAKKAAWFAWAPEWGWTLTWADRRGRAPGHAPGPAARRRPPTRSRRSSAGRAALGVLVREPGALGLHDRGEGVVLARDQLDLPALALGLAAHRRPDLGVDLGDRRPCGVQRVRHAHSRLLRPWRRLARRPAGTILAHAAARPCRARRPVRPPSTASRRRPSTSSSSTWAAPSSASGGATSRAPPARHRGTPAIATPMPTSASISRSLSWSPMARTSRSSTPSRRARSGRPPLVDAGGKELQEHRVADGGVRPGRRTRPGPRARASSARGGGAHEMTLVTGCRTHASRSGTARIRPKPQRE